MKENPTLVCYDSPSHRTIDALIQMMRLHRTVLEYGLRETEVYRSQHQILMYLADNSNVSQKEIADLHHVSTATIAVSLKKLEQGGYISRMVDHDDNRCNKICITEKGKAVVKNSRKIFQEIEQQMFAGISEEETKQLRATVAKISDNLCQCFPKTEREEQE